MFQNLESIMQYRICFLNLLLNFRFDSTNFHFLFFDNSFIFEWEIYIYHNSFIIYRFFFFFFLRFIIGFQSLKYMFCHQQYHLKENILFHIIKTFFSPDIIISESLLILPSLFSKWNYGMQYSDKGFCFVIFQLWKYKHSFGVRQYPKALISASFIE